MAAAHWPFDAGRLHDLRPVRLRLPGRRRGRLRPAQARAPDGAGPASRELVESRWPWICTMCGKCENVCPMEVRIADVVRRVRSLRAARPGAGHPAQGARRPRSKPATTCACPRRTSSSFWRTWPAEIREEPGFEDVPGPGRTRQGARVLTTIHNKLVNTHTEDLKHWWKIFHAAGESWTVVLRELGRHELGLLHRRRRRP
ncbi:MAG: hypothetical protein MZV70_64400 [Desulfobacterales bacterium]|nr:hypothetical protein [Desulfobacterales bacterium]